MAVAGNEGDRNEEENSSCDEGGAQCDCAKAADGAVLVSLTRWSNMNGGNQRCSLVALHLLVESAHDVSS